MTCEVYRYRGPRRLQPVLITHHHIIHKNNNLGCYHRLHYYIADMYSLQTIVDLNVIAVRTTLSFQVRADYAKFRWMQKSDISAARQAARPHAALAARDAVASIYCRGSTTMALA